MLFKSLCLIHLMVGEHSYDKVRTEVESLLSYLAGALSRKLEI